MSFLICATPRVGSTLLCGLLKSTGRAGVPESYFRKEDLQDWALKWHLIAEPGQRFKFSDFAVAARRAGTTSNGVFSARVMWGTMEELIDSLATMRDQSLRSAVELLQEAFGTCDFVYLRREDTVAQAVSLVRALQSGVWHRTQAADPLQGLSASYDRAAIESSLTQIERHNAAWIDWFNRHGISPVTVVYEQLSDDPLGTTRELLRKLRIDIDPNVPVDAPNIRMADRETKTWISRFRGGG